MEIKTQNLNRKIANATKWSMVAEIVSKLASPIVNMILARLLAPDEFGIVASITIITSFADIFTDAGFQKYIIQHEFEDDKTLRNYADVAFSANAIMSTVIFIIIFILRHPFANLIGCSGAYNGLAVSSLTVLCTAFSSIAIAGFRRDLNFKPLFFIRLGSSLIPLVITVPLAFLVHSYWALVIGTVGQQLFIAILSLRLSKYKVRFRIDLHAFSNMLSFSMWNLLESLSIWFTGQANIFIVAATLNSYYLGLYKTGMSTINSYMTIISTAITPVLFSALSRVQNDTTTYDNTFNNFQKLISIYVLPLGAGIFLYRGLAVKILLGNQWMEIADFMGLWALMSAFTITFSNLACEVYRSMGKPKISFFLQVIYLVFYIPAIYFSAKGGFRLLCTVSCYIRLLPIFFDFITLKNMFKMKLFNILRNVYMQFLAVAIMSILSLILQNISNTIVWQIISICICAICYIGIILMSPSTRKEMFSIMKLIKR